MSPNVSASLAVGLAALLLGAAPAYARHGSDDRSEHRSSGHHASVQTTTTVQNATVSSARAVEIARGQGLDSLHEVKFRDGAWKVEGPTAGGKWIEVYVHPTSGEVLRREIYAMHR